MLAALATAAVAGASECADAYDENCLTSRCCQDEGYRCFKRDGVEYAQCRRYAEPCTTQNAVSPSPPSSPPPKLSEGGVAAVNVTVGVLGAAAAVLAVFGAWRCCCRRALREMAGLPDEQGFVMESF